MSTQIQNWLILCSGIGGQVDGGSRIARSGEFGEAPGRKD
jgi:hypothetical protein